MIPTSGQFTFFFFHNGRYDMYYFKNQFMIKLLSYYGMFLIYFYILNKKYRIMSKIKCTILLIITLALIFCNAIGLFQVLSIKDGSICFHMIGVCVCKTVPGGVRGSTPPPKWVFIILCWRKIIISVSEHHQFLVYPPPLRNCFQLQPRAYLRGGDDMGVRTPSSIIFCFINTHSELTH